MTTIRLHGILRKEFGPVFKGKLRRVSDSLEAIDVNNEGFINRVMSLSKDGIHYGIIVDGKEPDHSSVMANLEPKEIDFVPMVCGSGDPITTFLAIKLVGGVTVGAVLGGFALTAASLFISSLLSPTPKLPQAKAPVAGSRESFIFSNKVNVAQQNVPVPVGYGRLRIGSAVIQSTIKSFPQNSDVLASLTTAAGGNSQDYSVISESNNLLSTTTASAKTSYGFDIVSELEDSMNSTSAVSNGEERAINSFVAQGIEDGWWPKIKMMNVFTWGEEPMNVIDWVNQQTGFINTSDHSTSGYAIGTSNVDGYFEPQYTGGGSLTLGKLNNDGVEYNNCLLAIAISGEWGTQADENVWLGHHDVNNNTYFSFETNSGQQHFAYGNADNSGSLTGSINSQRGVWSVNRTGDNVVALRASGVVVEEMASGTDSSNKTFANETGKFLALGMGSWSDILNSGGALSEVSAVAAGTAMTPSQQYSFTRSFRVLNNNLGAGIV